jgi:glycosyltransferase involved in cell wall biosynthesis
VRPPVPGNDPGVGNADASDGRRARAREPAGIGTKSDSENREDRGDGQENLRVLLVGPVQATGGIARYIDELRTHLPPAVAVAVHDTAAPPGSGPRRFARGVLGALADALRFPFRDRPDVVHIHTAEDYSFLRKSAYVLLTRYVWGRPVILHVHGPLFDRFLADAAFPLEALQRAVFAASSAIVVLSPYWERALSPSLPAGKVLVLPNAIDAEAYEPRFGSDEEGERALVAFVANHVPRKGIREFTDAIGRLMESGADCQVTIAGSGPLDDRSKRLAERYPDVEYLGYVSEERKRELLSEASIYVLPAYAEGLPIGVLEAMAGGNAVVATAVGGVPDLIDEQGGELVAPRDPEALAEALRRLVDDPEGVGKMGRHNAEVVEQYTWTRVIPRLTDLYESVATEGP